MKIIEYVKGSTIHLRCGITEYTIDKVINENGVNKRKYNVITVGHNEKLRDRIVELLNVDQDRN